MNLDDLKQLPSDDLERIDAACDALETAWQQGDPPALETTINEAPESIRRELAFELIRTEIELRVQAGQRPSADEYAARFPLWADQLQSLVAESLADPLFQPRHLPPTVTLRQPGGTDTSQSLSVPVAPTVPAITGMDEVILQALRGRFIVRGILGSGGMGVVLHARDSKLDRDVALKLLKPELSRDVNATQRFLREARSAATVRHDNVVTIYSADEINGVAFLEMELIEGESLADRIKRTGPLPITDVLQISLQVSRGLDAAHKRALIHRDIKPANILLESTTEAARLTTEPGLRAKITDFGLARVASESSLTYSGWLVGTPQYMSPEQAEGVSLDHRADLFSLGSVMYSMCTGKAAFHAESAVGVLRQVADRNPQPIREINPSVPQWLVAIIDKLMAKRPENRIQSAAEVAELLAKQLTVGEDGQPMSPARQEALLAKLVAAVVLVIGVVCTALFLSNKPAAMNDEVPKVVAASGNDSASISKATDNSPEPAQPAVDTTKPVSPDKDNTPKPHPLISDAYTWSKPVRLDFNSTSLDNNAGPCISADGLTLIFTRLEQTRPRLWESHRETINAPFGTATLLPSVINHPDAYVDCPFLSQDELTLYFTSSRSDGFGIRDLWMSHRQSRSAAWEAAINLGPEVNTSAFEQSPCVTDDELTLYFSRNVGGNFRLFRATRENKEAFFANVKELSNLNTGLCSSLPTLTADGLAMVYVYCNPAQGVLSLRLATRQAVADEFTFFEDLSPAINAGMSNTPSLSADGMTLYYAAQRGFGSDTHDLWSSTRVLKNP